MKIGFYIKWNVNSLTGKGNVLGDELLALSFCRQMNTIPGVEADIYAPNKLPTTKLDYLIYLNDNEPFPEMAKKHVVYLQNGILEDEDQYLKNLMSKNYDGYLAFSKKLVDKMTSPSRKVQYLPFGVDETFFYPREFQSKFNFDASYIGNDIKGTFRTENYLLPAAKYNFGLYGNWALKKHKYKIWKNFLPQPKYKKVFHNLSLGKIPQEDVPALYSSSKINLNCTLESCVEWDVITLRTLEVLACKGFLISDHVDSLASEFKDMLCITTGGKDLENKIDYFLSHEKERNQISEHGYEYVRKNHTIKARVADLMNYIQEV